MRISPIGKTVAEYQGRFLVAKKLPPPSFASLLTNSASTFEQLTGALSSIRGRLREGVADDVERMEFEREEARIAQALVELLYEMHKTAHPLDIMAMVAQSVVRNERAHPAPTTLRAHQAPRSASASSKPTREAILAELKGLVDFLATRRGAKEIKRIKEERFLPILKRWTDANYSVDDLRLAKLCVGFPDQLNGSHLKKLRAKIRELGLSEEDVGGNEELLPMDWPWLAATEGKRVLAFVGGAVVDARRAEIIQSLRLASLEFVVLGHEKSTRRLQSLNASIANRNYDVAFIPKEFGGDTSRQILDVCRSAGIVVVRLTWGTNLNQIRQAIETQISKPSPKEALKAS